MAQQQDPGWTDAQMLMLASTVAKLQQLENKTDQQRSKNGMPWQGYAISLIGVLFTVTSVIFWEDHRGIVEIKNIQNSKVAELVSIVDRIRENTGLINELREKINDIQREYARQADNIQFIPILRTGLEQMNVRLVNVENSQRVIEGRFNTITLRILAINKRLDAPVGSKIPMGEEGLQ